MLIFQILYMFRTGVGVNDFSPFYRSSAIISVAWHSNPGEFKIMYANFCYGINMAVGWKHVKLSCVLNLWVVKIQNNTCAYDIGLRTLTFSSDLYFISHL